MDAKLSGRLSNLQVNASRESVQTLAKWMSFNRKSADALSKTLLDRILEAEQPSRKLLYLSVAHEVLVADADSPTKWERMGNFRKVVGDVLIRPAVENVLSSSSSSSSSSETERIETMVRQWETKRSCGDDTPAIVASVKTLLERKKDESSSASAGDVVVDQTKKVETTAVVANDDFPAKSETEERTNKGSDEEVASPEASSFEERGNADANAEHVADSPTKPTSSEDAKTNESSPAKESPKKEPVDFDFESEGVEFGEVSAQDFLDPCKSIATMQIAREIRNDTAARLMTVLKSIPKEVEEYAAKVLAQKERRESNDNKEGEGDDDDDDEETRIKTLEKLPELPDDVLDVDVTEALAEVKQFRDVVLRQRQARKRCIDLLIRSRCRFGSDEAAREFFEIGKKIAQVKKRKLMLSDAMELEGLDFEGEGEDEGDGEEEILEPLSWFKEGGDAAA